MPRRPPALPTEASLRAQATAHLDRWPTTRAHLRRVLRRRVDKAIAHHGGAPDALYEAVDRVLDRLVASGQLDDAAFTRAKLRGLLSRGASPLAATSRLLAKGVPGELAREALADQRDRGVDPTLLAACNHARRRRIGPWRPEPLRAEHREADIARLGRAGFPFAVAREVIDTDDPDSLERRAEGREPG